MNKLNMLKWSFIMTISLIIASCSSSEDPKPNAAFSYSADADDFRIVNFTNESSQATEFEWDFGDGSDVSTEENPSHTYSNTGSFTVTLVAKVGTVEYPVQKSVSITATLTNKMLNGGSSKSWMLKPAAGSFQVGPTIGDESWWPQGEDISGARPCVFNDEFIFKTGGVYEYDSHGDLYAEPYLNYAVEDQGQCQDESTLPEGGYSAWGSGTHAYSFAAGTTPTITVTGTGAFVAYAKPKNGGRYPGEEEGEIPVPPIANASVTYSVNSYTYEDGIETLVIYIDVSGGGTGYWTFTLIHDNNP